MSVCSSGDEVLLNVVLVDVDEHVRGVDDQADTAGDGGRGEYQQLNPIDYQRYVLPVFDRLQLGSETTL